MQFALDRLDDLITQKLPGLRLETQISNPDLVDQLIHQVRNEINNIRKFLWDRLQNARHKKQIHILSVQYQTSLSFLLEKVEGYIFTQPENNRVKELYEPISELIKNTLSFIDSHFSIWLRPDPNEKDFFALFSLNEPEISALLCSFIDTHTITNHTYSSFLDFVAPLIATRQKKGLNAVSMLKSKDKLTPDMKKKVREVLLQMAREIDRY